MNIDSDLVPFLFMGCWNRDSTARDSVTDAIRNNPIDKLILGGDNIYPTKINGKKHYNIELLKDGFNRLRGKEIYTAIGNHNIGKMLELELKMYNIPKTYYCIHFNDYALVVFDTNILEGGFKEMSEWLLHTILSIQKSGKKYYYVQHEPFISFKKTKYKNGTTKIHTYKKINDIFPILLQYPPIAILCADTHNYQQGSLTMNNKSILQIIVGTGGASPDILNTPINTHSHEAITYTMKEYKPPYGYLQVTADTEFIEVPVKGTIKGTIKGTVKGTIKGTIKAKKRRRPRTRSKRSTRSTRSITKRRKRNIENEI